MWNRANLNYSKAFSGSLIRRTQFSPSYLSRCVKTNSVVPIKMKKLLITLCMVVVVFANVPARKTKRSEKIKNSAEKVLLSV